MNLFNGFSCRSQQQIQLKTRKVWLDSRQNNSVSSSSCWSFHIVLSLQLVSSGCSELVLGCLVVKTSKTVRSHQVSERLRLKLWRCRKSVGWEGAFGCSAAASRAPCCGFSTKLTVARVAAFERTHCAHCLWCTATRYNNNNNNKQRLRSRVGRDWLSTGRAGSQQTLGHSDRI